MNVYPSETINEKYDEIAELCKETGEPVFLTKKHKIDLVVMDIDTYKKLKEELKLREELLEEEKSRHRKTGVYLNSFNNTYDS